MTGYVAILGSGPDGLLVAHAAAMSGWTFRLYGSREKTKILGPQYLQEPIPGMTEEATIIHHHLVGDDLPGDWVKKSGLSLQAPGAEWTEYGWDLRACYDKLWNAYSDNIRQVNEPGFSKILASNPIEFIRDNAGDFVFDLMVSTLSRTLFAAPDDVFETRSLWRITDDSENGIEAPFGPAEDNTVILDGTEDVGWFRMSKVFGRKTIDWPMREGARPPVENLTRVDVPISYRPGLAGYNAIGFVHLGAQAKWNHTVTPCDSFRQALNIFATYPGNPESPWQASPYAPPKD